MSNIKKKSGLALDIKSKANKTNFMGALERGPESLFIFPKFQRFEKCEFLILFCF